MQEWSCKNQHQPVHGLDWNLQVLDYRRSAILGLAWNIKGNACSDCDQLGSKFVEVELLTMRGENPSLSFFLGDIPRMAWLFAVTCE